MSKLRRAAKKLKKERGVRGKITLILRWFRKRLGHFFYDELLRGERRRRSLYDRLLLDKDFAQQFIEDNAPMMKTDGLALDAGCGIGTWPAAFSTSGKTIVAVDIAPNDYWHRVTHASFLVADVTTMPFRDSIFHLCLCLTVLEETRDDKLVLQEIRRVLVSKGRFLLKVPNKGNLKTRATGKMLYAKHLREYEKNEITLLLEHSGFTIKSIRIAGFYSPIFTRFVNTLISRHTWLSLGELLPEKYRGVITVICEKAT